MRTTLVSIVALVAALSCSDANRAVEEEDATLGITDTVDLSPVDVKAAGTLEELSIDGGVMADLSEVVRDTLLQPGDAVVDGGATSGADTAIEALMETKLDDTTCDIEVLLAPEVDTIIDAATVDTFAEVDGGEVDTEGSCPHIFLDMDGDGQGDVLCLDEDCDGIPDKEIANYYFWEVKRCHGGMTTMCMDNCPDLYNPAQEDQDDDAYGDPCDCDANGNGVAETCSCDEDMDGFEKLGDGCGHCNLWGACCDVCDCDDKNSNSNPCIEEEQLAPSLELCAPFKPEPWKEACKYCDGYDNDCDGLTDEGCDDLDQDGTPDCLSPDMDGDFIPTLLDNCPCIPNDDQHDKDSNGIGDACDS